MKNTGNPKCKIYTTSSRTIQGRNFADPGNTDTGQAAQVWHCLTLEDVTNQRFNIAQNPIRVKTLFKPR